MSDRFLGLVGQRLIGYLQQPSHGYEPPTPGEAELFTRVLQPGDVLLIEGVSRISGVIKYLTQSTWSHSALYIGNRLNKRCKAGDPHVLIEAELGKGVISAPLSKYANYHMRVCRPIGLLDCDREAVVNYMIKRLGYEYDVKNIVDLIRYLVPMPVPARFRRRMLALGSGDPTKAICSSLIAQAFESVRYPILPKIERMENREARREVLHIRHHSLYMPRDFDISPYFEVVKPTIRLGFDYKRMHWANVPRRLQDIPEVAAAASVPLAPQMPADTPTANTGEQPILSGA
jgi:hypothetical protein